MSINSIDQMLYQLSGSVPQARTQLSEADKDQLIATVGGVLTAQNIIKAKNDYTKERIPFLFSTLDTQAVVDILANDMEAAVDRAMARRAVQKSRK
ncbi:MAG: hypothetical protein ACOH5I_17270 [Oligoflexus sp.]